MNGIFWDGVKEEFGKAADGVRDIIYRDIQHLYTYCKNCSVQQEKGVGWLGRRLPAWELKSAEDVTRMISTTVSNKNLPPNIRGALNLYRDNHVKYDCKGGLKIIESLLDSLEECLTDHQK